LCGVWWLFFGGGCVVCGGVGGVGGGGGGGVGWGISQKHEIIDLHVLTTSESGNTTAEDHSTPPLVLHAR